MDDVKRPRLGSDVEESTRQVAEIVATSVEQAVRLETPLAETYVRTRHNNLRCFPKCSPFHMEQRFCGRALEVSVSGMTETGTPQVTIFGEFRNKRAHGLFELGSGCSKDRLSDLGERIMFAEFVRRIGGQDRFVIHPPRKWHYPGKLRAIDWHVIQIYLVVGETIQATFTSSAFHVIPIWKSDEKEKDANGVSASIAAAAAQADAEKEEDSDSPSMNTASTDGSSGAESRPRSSSSSNASNEKETIKKTSSAREIVARVASGSRVIPATFSTEKVGGAGAHQPVPTPRSSMQPSQMIGSFSPGREGNKGTSNQHGLSHQGTTSNMSYLSSPFVNQGGGGNSGGGVPRMMMSHQIAGGGLQQQQQHFMQQQQMLGSNQQASFYMGSPSSQAGSLAHGYFQMSGSGPTMMMTSSHQSFRPSPTTSPIPHFGMNFASQQQQHSNQFQPGSDQTGQNQNRLQSHNSSGGGQQPSSASIIAPRGFPFFFGSGPPTAPF